MSTQVIDERTPRQQLAQLVGYGRHGWASFGCGLLRSTGFPVDGLEALCADGLLDSADAAWRRGGVDEQFIGDYDRASRTVSENLSQVAGDSRLALAMTWQNPAMLPVLQQLQEAEPDTAKRRKKERRLALYWQRYCAKAETIGFYGPFAWIPVEAITDNLRCSPGKDLVGATHHAFEAWMVIELGKHLARRPEVRWWLPPVISPAVGLDEDQGMLLVPQQAPIRLRAEELQVLRLADGTRSAADICSQSRVAEDRVRKILGGMTRRRLVQWDANIPVSVQAWQMLRQRVDAIGDSTLRDELHGLLGRFDLAMLMVADASDAESLREALEALDELFTQVTGVEASRSHGQAYAARTLAYFDSTRDVEATLGTGLLDSIDEPLSLLLRSADWFAERLATGYEEAISRLVASQDGPVRVSDVWASTMRMFWSDDPVPLREAVLDLSERWTSVLEGLAIPDGESRVSLGAADLRPAVAAAFPHTTPMPELSVHSPDLQIVANSVEEVNAGNYTVVLGELHACFPSLEAPALEWALGGGQVRDAVNEAIGLNRIVPLFPDNWKRNTGRLVPATYGAGDRVLGFSRVACRDRASLWSMSELVFRTDDAGLHVVSPDGQRWRLAQVWAVPIAMVAADAFKVGLSGEHTPRLTIDNLVLFREAWKVTTDGLALPRVTDRHRDFLAARKWQQELGLPDEVFVKFPHETKPLLLHFSSPPTVATFLAMVRATRDHRLAQTVNLSEALPEPSTSWLSDAQGRRYVSELRLQITQEKR